MIPYIVVPDFHLGYVTIHPFGVLVATGVLVGSAITVRRARRLGYDAEELSSFLGFMLVSAFVAGHVLDSLMYHFDEVAARPWSLFLLWEGLSSFGGFIGAVAGVVLWKYYEWRSPWFVRRAAPMPILAYSDLVMSVLPIGWAFGRSGCSVVHDHPGALAPAGSWLAVAYPVAGRELATPYASVGFIRLLHGPVPTYDLGFLELLFTIVLAICFALTWRRRLAIGSYIAAAALSYAPIRFMLDFLRDPPPLGDERYDLFGWAFHGKTAIALTPAQWLCIVLFAFGLAMVVHVWRSNPARAARSAVAERPASMPTGC